MYISILEKKYIYIYISICIYIIFIIFINIYVVQEKFKILKFPSDAVATFSVKRVNYIRYIYVTEFGINSDFILNYIYLFNFS